MSESKLTVTLVTGRNSLPEIKERWSRLLGSCKCSSPYLQFEWYASALETLDRDKAPFLIFFTSSGVDVGLAPLVYQRHKAWGFTTHKLSFVNNSYTPWQGFLYTCPFEEFAARLLDFLKQRFGKRFVLDLNELRPDADEQKTFERLRASRSLLVVNHHQSRSLLLPLQLTFDATLASLSTKARHEMARKQSRLARLGSVGLLRIEGARNIAEHLDRFFRLYADTWKGAEPCPEFYRRVCQAFAERGDLYFTALTLDELPIAYLIAFRSGVVFYGCKTTYDPSFYAFSPGVILFYRTIADVCSWGTVRVVDFGRGEEQYKREWLAQAQDQVRIYITPNNINQRAFHMLRHSVVPRLKATAPGRRMHDFLKGVARWRKNDHVPPITTSRDPGEREIPVSQVDAPFPEAGEPQTARWAGPEDKDWLAVLMASRNLREVESLMAANLCVVIGGERRLKACFWLPKPSPNGCGAETNGTLRIRGWAINAEQDPALTPEHCVGLLVRFLRDRGRVVSRVLMPWPRSSCLPGGRPCRCAPVHPQVQGGLAEQTS